VSFRRSGDTLDGIVTQELEARRKAQQQIAVLARDQQTLRSDTATDIASAVAGSLTSIGATDFGSGADNLGTGDATYATVALEVPVDAKFLMAHAVGMFFVGTGEDCRMLIRYTDPDAAVTDDGMEARADPPATADYRLTLNTHVMLVAPAEGAWTFELRARKIAAVATSQIQLRRLSVFAVT
jgi:hypothetical protein